MNRRQLLQGAAVASLPLPAAAMPASPDTPILRLFRRQQSLVDAAEAFAVADGGEQLTNDDMDRLFFNEINALEARMMAEPCTCSGDFAAKMIVETCRGGPYSDWETGPIWQEARALTAPTQVPYCHSQQVVRSYGK